MTDWMMDRESGRLYAMIQRPKSFGITSKKRRRGGLKSKKAGRDAAGRPPKALYGEDLGPHQGLGPPPHHPPRRANLRREFIDRNVGAESKLKIPARFETRSGSNGGIQYAPPIR